MPSQPVIVLAVTGPVARDALAGAMRSRYGDRYRVLATGGVADTVAALNELAGHGSRTALVLAEPLLPDGGGAELLALATGRSPGVRSLLLDGTGDDTAGEPGGTLFPAVDDRLFDWEIQHGAGGPRVHLIGERFAAGTYRLKDFLHRNAVPFRWSDPADGGDDVPEAGAGGFRTTAVLPDGTVLTDPGIGELALGLGLTRPASKTEYDLVVVGGGPAGLAGSVYGACEGLNVLVVEDDAPGGQAGSTSRIENYLGFPAGLSGSDLAQRALVQARRFGVEWVSTRIATGLAADGDHRVVSFDDGSLVRTKVVLVASGMQWRRLDAPGIERLTGAGIYYGACLSEAQYAADEDVFMVGAGNSTGQAALHFADQAKSVTLLVRGKTLSRQVMSSYLADRVEQHPRITVRPHTEVAEALGDDRLGHLRLRDLGSGEVEEVPARTLYVLIGSEPCSAWVAHAVARDDRGFVLTSTDVRANPGRLPRPWPLERDPLLMETSLPGVFAAGDVRSGSVKRVGSAVGEGAVAVQAIAQYLKETNDKAPALDRQPEGVSRPTG